MDKKMKMKILKFITSLFPVVGATKMLASLLRLGPMLISHISIIMSKKHNLILIFEPVIGDSHISRTSSYIKQTILTFIKCIMVNQNYYEVDFKPNSTP